MRSEDTEYRLKRWPAASLVNKDVAKVRLATLVFRRPMGLQEASDLSRIPSRRCEEFLLEWAQRDLLVLSDGPRHGGQEKPRASARPQPDPVRRSGLGASLIRSIRNHFGIA